VTVVKSDLIKSVEDTKSDRQSTTSSPQPKVSSSSDSSVMNDLDLHLRELVNSQQFGKAIKVLHHIRTQFLGLKKFIFSYFID
jgi:cell division FtsZ-interacting protein ZapD